VTVRVGDFLWFWANASASDETPDVQPEIAQVVFVAGAAAVNLVVTSHAGARRILLGTFYYDGVTGSRPASNFCEHIPPAP
jgi:hypothetical protein